MRRRLSPALACALIAAACASPEATRSRGGGAGADPGNRGGVIEIHEGAQPYHQTPCVTTIEECTGPGPVFGATAQDSV